MGFGRGTGGNNRGKGFLTNLAKEKIVRSPKKDVCPLSNFKLAVSDSDKFVSEGQAYRLSELLKPGARQNGAKKYFNKFKLRFNNLQNQEELSYNEKKELAGLVKVLEKK